MYILCSILCDILLRPNPTSESTGQERGMQKNSPQLTTATCILDAYYSTIIAYSQVWVISTPLFYCKSFFSWSYYFCGFRERLNNAKTLARELEKIIMYVMSIIFASQN